MIEERLQGPANPSILRLLDALEDLEAGIPEDDVILLAHVRNQLDLVIANAAQTIAEDDLYEGYCSPIQWLRCEAKLPTGVSMSLVDVAFQSVHMPATMAALAEGEIGFAHVALMAGARVELNEHFREDYLLDKARTQTVTEFRKTLEHARHAADPEYFAWLEARGRDARNLKLSPQEDGSMFVKGWFEPEGASLVRSALEPLARKAGHEDDRTREQRLGDALVERASEGVQAELIVTVPLETLVQAQSAPAAETEWGGIVSSEVVQRLLCDSSVRRLVLDGAGQVVDFGRRRRLFKGSQRKALVARDRHCVFPWCDRPARWCDGHHLKAHAEGGGTDLENGLLLCGRHHYLCHEGGWKLVRDGTEYRAIAPRRWPPPVAAEAA